MIDERDPTIAKVRIENFLSFIGACLVSLIFFIILFYNEQSIKQQNIREFKKQDSIFKELYYSIIDTFEKEAFLVTVTTFNPEVKQTDNTPNITSIGFKIDTINPFKQKIVGLSRDLLEEFYYGEQIVLENCGKFNGEYTVVDCGNLRLIRTVDICINKNQLGGRFKNVVLKHKFRK